MNKCPVCDDCSLRHAGSKSGIMILRCTSCEALVADCAQPPESFYESDNYLSGGVFGYAPVRSDGQFLVDENAMRRVRTVAGFDIVVEIGAGSGVFQRCLRDSGIKSLGIERSAGMREVARNVHRVDLLSSPRDLRLGDLQSNPPRVCIVLIEVIEHIRDPVTFMNGLMLDMGMTPDAIFATMPNGDAASGLMGLKWEQVKPPEHIILYGQRTIFSLAQRIGFRVSSIRRYNSVFLRMASGIFGRRSDRRIPALWIITGLLRKFDSVICRLLPSRYSLGVEILLVRR